MIVRKIWCGKHFHQILEDFNVDLPSMTRFNQRYFGDWVNYCGYSDVGYYLGTRFVQELCNQSSLEELVNLIIDDVYKVYLEYVNRYQ